MNIGLLIGINLRRLRKARNLRQDELAGLVGITKPSMSGIENGRIGMGKDLMLRMCTALNVKPWEFFLDETTPVIRDREEEDLLLAVRALPDGVREEVIRFAQYLKMTRGEQTALELIQRAKQEGVADEIERYAQALIENAEKTNVKKATPDSGAPGTRR